MSNYFITYDLHNRRKDLAIDRRDNAAWAPLGSVVASYFDWEGEYVFASFPR